MPTATWTDRLQFLLSVDPPRASFLGWLWNKLYRGPRSTEQSRCVSWPGKGMRSFYVPCHRSPWITCCSPHVIYHQGMVPPHIAAGINLNFWPAGPIFRHGGAFFIRRTFKGNPLYSTVFREYLNLLLPRATRWSSSPRGGRSRTGRLLPPKTGMLAMTLQAMMRGLDRPVTLVPVYLGYEHVMEVNTYHNEPAGSCKEKESFLQVLGILRKLCNYGRGFCQLRRTADPQQLPRRTYPPGRRASAGGRPEWMASTVNQLAELLMTRINDAAAVNGLRP